LVATPKLVTYATLTGLGLLAAVVFANAAIIGLAAPFGFALVVGLLAPVAPLPEIGFEIDTPKLLEGSYVTLTITVTSPAQIPRCEVALGVPQGLQTEGPTVWSLRVDADNPVTIELPIVARDYGRFKIGPATAGISGLFGLLARSAARGGVLELEVQPRSEVLRTLVRAREVRANAGDRLAHQPGDGIEFAEVKPYVPGTAGRLNWRATARRGAPYVNLYHPERSTDVIILLDTFSPSAITQQVRAGASLARAYLARHDRVGLVAFGGVLNWVDPSAGRGQMERIIAALARTQWHHSYAWKSAEAVPSRALPLNGLVIAVSPLEDGRMMNALASIRSRGVDLAVIETAIPATRHPMSLARDTAARILELERVGMRDNFQRRGVPVIAWSDGEPLEVPLHALAIWRRRVRGRVAR
jgi:uncharacterized protein (DUF58 family)